MKIWLTGAKLGFISWIILLFITVFLDPMLFAASLLLGWVLPFVGWAID